MNCELIKVCGMREPENIRAVESLGIDWMGFIFWEKSSRYVAEKPAYLPERCKRVGVFVDADQKEIVSKTEEYGLNIIQLHGHESPEYVAELRRSLSNDVKLIKAISMDSLIFTTHQPHFRTLYSMFTPLVDAILFDTKNLLPGGSGKKFDWNVLDTYDGEKPFLISGGIGPDDAEQIRRFIEEHPKCMGIDLNSCFEIAPGLKDVEKLRTFINSLKR